VITNLKIHWKLTLLTVLLLLPITLLAWLLITQSYQDINFAEKELEGNRYISLIRPLIARIAAGQTDIAVAQLGEIERLNTEIGKGMSLGDSATLGFAAVRSAATATVETKDAAASKAVTTLQNLITEVGDGSNLILDPDLDSFYTMDLVVVKTPNLESQIVEILNLARSLKNSKKVTISELANFERRIGEAAGTLDGAVDSLQRAVKGSNDGSLKVSLTGPFDEFRDATKTYLTGLSAFAEAAGGAPGPSPTIEDLARQQATAESKASVFWETASKELDRLLTLRISGFRQKLNLSLAISIGIVLIAVLISLLIAQSLSRSVSDLVTAMGRMANGDLWVDIGGTKRGDEAGALARAATQMSIQLRGLASEVRGHSTKVLDAASTIETLADSQSSSSSEMASSVAEISSTMEQLSASSSQIAAHSRSVADIAAKTWESSKVGQSEMEQVAALMSSIHDDNQETLREVIDLGRRSKEIGTVMEIISNVADQTKLIAFNAALEAASAGDAGRRFVVVASEIRRLADSVTDSTNEIAKKIKEIQDSISRLVVNSEKSAKGIAAGLDATDHVAANLTTLVAAADQTNGAAEQISLSTQQQRIASDQVVMALREIALVSAENTKNIEQITKNAHDLTTLSGALKRAAGKFRLTEGEASV
jgi:methyl-accepting chemotaxis protein